jgi:hypothetical protein
VATQRHKVRFREGFRVAWRTVPLWQYIVPIVPALLWWWKGVPEDKLRLAETPSRWQRMSATGRVLTIACYVIWLLFVAAIAIAIFAAG